METSTNNNYSGYNTYILGTANSILNCLNITVYNKSDLPADSEKLSLYNIDTIYQSVIELKIGTVLSRQNSSEKFEYSTNGKGFNTIIYLNNSDNSPIGYTEFLSVQGKSRNIDISLAFNSEISGGFTVNLANSLSQLRNNTTVKTQFIGEDLHNYTSSIKIKEDLSSLLNNSPNYTTHLSSIIKSGDSQNIFLRNGILNGSTLIKLDFSKNINIDPFENGFNNYQFGFYKSDIVIYLWKGLDYSIYSITKRNRFGNPICYIDSSTGYKTAPNYIANISQSILYFSGRYIIVDLGNYLNYYVIYDSENNKWINTESEFIVDPLDLNSKIIELPKIINYNNISRYLPGISNIYLDIKDYSSTNTISMLKKIGDWYAIRRKRDNLVIYTNMDKTIYLRSDENPIIINNKLLMIHSKYPEENLDYYTIYTGSKNTFYSEKARVILETITNETSIYNPELTYSNELGIMICLGGIRDEEYKNYYQNKDIKIVSSNESIISSYFSQFRRNNLPTNSIKVPNIIGSIGGLLYYISNDYYLNFL